MQRRTILRKLTRLTPADLGFKVTVCIAAICQRERIIVTASDMKVSFGSYSVDDLSLKAKRIAPNWVALMAGDDISEASLVVDATRSKLSSVASPTSAEAADALQAAYRERIERQIEAQILANYGYTLPDFLANGKAQLTDDVFDKLCDKISSFNLELQFILAGFEQDGVAHLYGIDGKAAPACHDPIGFWAIGSGDFAALSTLSFHSDRGNMSRYLDLAETIYCVCDAKFRAESASGVGKTTFLTIYEHDREVRFISPMRIEHEIRPVWDRLGAHRPPKRIIQSLPNMIYDVSDFFADGGGARFLDPTTQPFGPTIGISLGKRRSVNVAKVGGGRAKHSGRRTSM